MDALTWLSPVRIALLTAGAMLGFAGGLVGCVTADETDCGRGTLGCLCFPDGGCEFGLQCEGTICQVPAGEDGASDESAGADDSADDDDDDDDDDGAPGPDGEPDPGFCGDASCDPDEDCDACPEDCGECPAACGDATCDATETCDACPEDCGECCGDGSCEASVGEDWANCWSDCESEAPKLAFSGMYPDCVGQSDLDDGNPASDSMWISSDTLALMYVDGDVVYELSGSELMGQAMVVGAESIGTLACHQTSAGSCVPVLRAAPQSCNEAARVVDMSNADGSASIELGEEFEPCMNQCGNGACDYGEGPCYGAHLCSSDCPTPAPGCEQPSDGCGMAG